MQFLRAVTSTDSNVYGNTFRLRKLIWTSPGASESVVIKNGAGTVVVTLATGTSNVADYPPVDFGEEGLVMTGGMQVTTLGAGTLYVYGA